MVYRSKWIFRLYARVILAIAKFPVGVSGVPVAVYALPHWPSLYGNTQGLTDSVVIIVIVDR